MNRRSKRTIAIGAVAALAAAGGGAAYAAATGSTTAADRRDAFLADAAGRLHVTSQQLRDALQGAFVDQLQQAVRDGHLTQAQADRIAQQVKARGLPLGPGGPGGPAFGPGGPGFGPGGPGHGPLGVGLDAAATYLGVTRADLIRGLQGGKTLAAVAKAQGKSVDGLEQALVDAARSALDRAVADGRLTSAQRDDVLRDLQQHVADVVNGRGFGLRIHRDWRGGPPPGGPGVPPPPWGGP